MSGSGCILARLERRRDNGDIPTPDRRRKLHYQFFPDFLLQGGPQIPPEWLLLRLHTFTTSPAGCEYVGINYSSEDLIEPRI